MFCCQRRQKERAESAGSPDPTTSSAQKSESKYRVEFSASWRYFGFLKKRPPSTAVFKHWEQLVEHKLHAKRHGFLTYLLRFLAVSRTDGR